MSKLRSNLVLFILLISFIFVISAETMAYTWSSGGSNYYSTRSYYSSSNSGSYYSSYYSNYYSSKYNNNDSSNSNTIVDEGANQENNSDDSQTNNGGTNEILLQSGMSGQAVKNIQIKLDRLGYDVGSINSYYGRQTIVAVMYFQRDNNLKITGKVDVETKNKIDSKYEIRYGSLDNNNDNTNNDNTNNNNDPENNNSANEGENIQENSSLEEEMLNLINSERTSRGIAPLQMDQNLVELARKKSQDMIDNNYFSHSSPIYGSPFKMLNDAGINYRAAGENIAGNNSVSGAHRALMNSSGHRGNILNTAYTKVGIGIVKGGPYGMMFTQLFIG
jgi:uncharacterized YkwD family protein